MSGNGKVRSMTGFGRAAASLPGANLRVEIRTLNGRYLDAKIRTPKDLNHLEPELRKRAHAALNRGRVDLNVEVDLPAGGEFQLNETLVLGYEGAVRRLRELGFEGELGLASILQLPGVLEPRRLDMESGALRQAVLDAADSALAQALQVRDVEGEALRADLDFRLRRLGALLEEIEPLSATFAPYYRERLRRRIEELSNSNVADEARLAQEILFHAERADVSEEISRLKTHIERFFELLESPSEEGIGKNLDFLCQEMNREMNTIVSKSPLPDASRLAVEGKLEIEKIREQVQNVE